MRKVFCDKCGAEITRKNDCERLTGTIKVGLGVSGVRTSDVEFFFNQNSKQLRHDICMHCIIDAVNRLDDRTRAEPV